MTPIAFEAVLARIVTVPLPPPLWHLTPPPALVQSLWPPAWRTLVHLARTAGQTWEVLAARPVLAVVLP